MKKEKLLLDRIKKDIKKAKVVSFDIFDTLLVRPYVKPTDLFLHMEKAFERPGFAEERRDAERRTRIRHKELEDVTFDMIYEEIDDEFKDMKQKEMDWEEMVLRANPELKQVYDYAKELGKTIIIASDMYMPTEFLAKVLRKNGFDGWEKLYVSGDSNLKKRTGSMYNDFFTKYNCLPRNVVHIGDNKESDYEIPKKLGVKVVLYKQVVSSFIENNQAIRVFRKKTIQDLGSSILAGVLAYRWQMQRCSLIDNNYWKNIGYSYAGPLALGFCCFVEQQAIKKNINNILFVARDGYLLQKIFNSINVKKIKNSYIYAPRILKQFFTLKYEKIRDAKGVFDVYASVSDDILQLAPQDKRLSDLEYNNIIKDNKELFLSVSQNIIKNYLSNLNDSINADDTLGLVDSMTTNFSSYKLLKKILKNNIHGIYVGTYAKNDCYGNNKYSKFIDETVRPRLGLFLEFLLSSTEYPIESISISGKPIFSNLPNKHEIYRAEVYKLICDAAQEFVQDLKLLFGEHLALFSSQSIYQLINSLILFPCKTDIEKMSKIWYATDSYHKDYKPLLSYFASLYEVFLHPIKSYKLVELQPWKTSFQKFLCYGIYHKSKIQNIKSIKLLGLPFYKKVRAENITKTYRFFKLFKTVKNKVKGIKKYYILGIKVFSYRFSYQTQILESDMRRIIDSIALKTQRALSVAFLHQKTFGPFRHKHEDESIILIGAGPTVKYFTPISGAIYVGLNRAVLYDKIKYDYLFAIDKKAIDQYYDEFLNYDCIKFVGDQNINASFQIPENVLVGKNNIYRYKTTARYLPNKFAYDLETEALQNSVSVSIQAMQFILFTNPKKIYVVGIDCSIAKQEHFKGKGYDIAQRGENPILNDQLHINDWKKIKDFASVYYPETEIISVNPVGLKGIFRDVYTRSYLHKHPEIDPEYLEIIDDGEIQ